MSFGIFQARDINNINDIKYIVNYTNAGTATSSLDKLEPNMIDNLFSHISTDDDLLFAINLVCMTNEELKLDQLLATIDSKKINFKFNQEFLYRLIRHNHLRPLQKILEFSKNYTGQDFHAEKLGEYYCEREAKTTLGYAILNANFGIVKTLVMECGATGSSNQDVTPVHQAAKSSNLEMLKFLVSQDPCQLNKTCSEGETPLLHACWYPEARSNVEFLIENGSDVNFRGPAGKYPLHCTNNLECIKLLVSAGADLTKKDATGMTCFVNVCGQNIECVKFIHEELEKRFKGSDYYHNELRDGFIQAVNQMMIENVEYLLRFIESKDMLNSRLREIFEINSPTILGHCARDLIVSIDKIDKFYKICSALIRYDFHPYPDQPMFFVQKFVELLGVKYLSQYFHRLEPLPEIVDDPDIRETLKQVNMSTRNHFIKRVRELLEMLEKYGRLNLFEFEDLGMSDNCTGFDKLNDCIASILSDMKARKRPSFLTICRNQIRTSMPGMSDNQIQKLELPSQLKEILF